MRLIGILSWYDESPSWLVASVGSMINRLGCDHIVAVDGAYALLPEGKPCSGFEQHMAIDEICRASDCGVTLFAPQEPWVGNEIEKRSYCFQLAETIAEIGEDWYFILDADEVVTSSTGAENVKQILRTTEHDTGEAWAYERFDPFVSPGSAALAKRIEIPRESRMGVRKFFRALPRLHVADNHFSYIVDVGAEKRVLWNGGNGGSVPSVDTRIEVEHRTRLRDLARKNQQAAYYERRGKLGIEHAFVPIETAADVA